MLINKDLDINRLKENIDSIEQVVKENNLQADRKHNIAIARIEELKKNLQNLREDVEFYQSMNA
jgi:predicted RNase H-like nuclease (RuvC/YqgF family)